ncbi:MAG: hypothetical protein RIC95_11590 [Vicingaceae bacterium]
MDYQERLYFGLGIIAYAVAKADGKVNAEEKRKLHDLVEKETLLHNPDIDISEITFHVLEKYDGYTQDDLYKLGLKEINLGKSYLTDDMRTDFPALLEKVARSFHPITQEENNIVERLRKDINRL